MKPKIARTHANSAGESGGLERFLFEDDHDVTRAVVTFLSSRVAVRRFVTRGLLVLGLLLVALLASMAAEQLALRPKEAAEKVPGQSAADPAAAFIDELSPLVAGEDGVFSALGNESALRATENRNYTFGFMEALGRTTPMGGSDVALNETRSGRNSAAVLAQHPMSGGGGSSGGGGGGGAPSEQGAARRNIGAEQAVSKVPDAGHSLGLLGLAVGLLFVGQWFQIYRHR